MIQRLLRVAWIVALGVAVIAGVLALIAVAGTGG